MTTHKILVPCPYCGQPNNGQTNTDGGDASPVAGAASICWNCIQISIYELGPLGLMLRKPTEDEQREIATDEYIQQAVSVIADSSTPFHAVERLCEITELDCKATAALCRCGLKMHTDDIPHECYDQEVCGGAWYGDSLEDEAFQVVRFPREPGATKGRGRHKR